MVKGTRNGTIILAPDRCDFCGTCVAVCPVDCIELGESHLTIDHNICTLCMNCVNVCPAGALSHQTTVPLNVPENKV